MIRRPALNRCLSFSLAALGALPPAAAIAGLAIAPNAPAAGVAATALPPFSLGDGFTIPHRLVARIRAGEFLDMAELLPDNKELLRREAAMFAEREPQGAPRVRPVLRQIPSILSWARCFCAYAAVRCSGARSAGHNFWVYLRLILQEAARNGGDGWRLYNTRFRQLAAADATANWGVVLPGLYAQTFVALGRLSIPRCVHCLDGDHVAADCALAPLAPVSKPKAATTVRSQRERAPADKPICRLYNAGRCTFRDCSFRHVCANCKGQHRSRDCAEDSEAKRPRSPRAEKPNGE